MDHDGISFQAIFARATTLVDGGWRVSFDVNADDAKHITTLSLLKDTLLQIAVVPIPEEALSG